MTPRYALLVGPPFGPPLLRHVQDRLGGDPARSVLDSTFPEHGWRERAEALVGRLGSEPVVVVAHGLAAPVAIAAALKSPPAALVLSNGPITRLDSFTAIAARMAGSPGSRALLEHALLRPPFWLRWLASSAGLRRAVVNPYVMDRDTVALLCQPSVATPADRQATVAYLRSLAEGLPDVRAVACPVLLAWGSGDPLYPASEADYAEAGCPRARHLSIPGGRFVHPEERPWAMADAIEGWLVDQGLRGATTTTMS